MNPEREVKPSSTAKRLRRAAARQRFFLLLLVDILFFGLVAAGWCYRAERDYAGEADPWTLYRTVDRRLDAERTEDGALRVWYTLSAPGTPPRIYDATVALNVTLTLAIPLAAMELLLLALASAFSAAQIRRQLRPLNRLSEAAQRLSRASMEPPNAQFKAASAQKNAADSGVPLEKFHSLESAIERISPDAPGQRLYTGDRDLAGLESAINGLLSRMQASYRQQTRFVDDASHELRTPIAVVKGYADLLARWGRNDEKILDEGIAAIQTETERMNRLVEQLLFLAHGDSGRTQMQFEEVDLSALLREVYEESRMIHPGHAWQFVPRDGVRALADTGMLKQAARILVDNAAKYTKAGETIRLSVVRGADGAPGLEVQDSGVGIAESDMPHVFERFYRADPARTGGAGGSGLGLSIAKWIVDRHGGYFDVVSLPDAGTRITIRLPVSAAV